VSCQSSFITRPLLDFSLFEVCWLTITLFYKVATYAIFGPPGLKQCP
jgi:hypothetical protein